MRLLVSLLVWPVWDESHYLAMGINLLINLFIWSWLLAPFCQLWLACTFVHLLGSNPRIVGAWLVPVWPVVFVYSLALHGPLVGWMTPYVSDPLGVHRSNVLTYEHMNSLERHLYDNTHYSRFWTSVSIGRIGGLWESLFSSSLEKGLFWVVQFSSSNIRA